MEDVVKVYRRDGGIMLVGEVPDGALCMEVGPQADRDATITAIDYDARTYDEVLGDVRTRIATRYAVPFPSTWYRIADVEWKEHRR